MSDSFNSFNMEGEVINYDEYGKSMYCRSYSTPGEILSFTLSKRYNCKNCILASSGMAAITGVLSGVIDWDNKNNCHYNLIHGNELYSDDQTVFNILAKHHDISLYPVDIRYPDTIVETFQSLTGQNNILFIESCSNPNGYLFDYSIIPTLRNMSNSLVFIVDNTWLTSEVFNPFNHGADFVILSLSKYYSAGQGICGAILQNKNYENDNTVYSIYDWFEFVGQHIPPKRCDLITNSIATMNERIHSSYNLTIQVCNYLRSLNVEVHHPSLHQQNLSESQFIKYGPSILTFNIVRPIEFRPKRPLKLLKHIKSETSYGSKKSRFCPWSISSDFNELAQTRTITYRLALGYEDNYDDVISDIDTLLTCLTM